MNVKTVIKWLEEFPKDYNVCFSEYTSIVVDEKGKDEEYFVVIDSPIVGMLKNDDTKEIRFFTKISKERVIKEIEGGKNWKKIDNVNMEK